jgi:hypothetical protein
VSRCSDFSKRATAGTTCEKAAKQPDIGKRVDDAMEAIEHENPTLRGFPAEELPVA